LLEKRSLLITVMNRILNASSKPESCFVFKTKHSIDAI
jgi:hypothetical protein